MAASFARSPAFRTLSSTRFSSGAGPIDSSVDYELALSTRMQDTGQWLLRSHEYTRWRESRAPILWLHGFPGSGKTVLCATAINNIQTAILADNPAASIGLAYFFFKQSGDPRRCTLNGLLVSLITQIASQGHDRGTQPGPNDPQKHWNGTTASSNDLIFSLINALKLMAKAYIFIDALDECRTEDRPKLFSFIEQLQDFHSQGFDWQIFLTSRRQADITSALDRLDTLQVLADNTSVQDDIQQFISSRFTLDVKLSKLPQELKPKVIDLLATQSHGMFLFAAMAVGLVRRAERPDKIIDSIPQTLHDLYSRILQDIDIHAPHKTAVTVLRWLACAQGPLSLKALAAAVTQDGPNVSDPKKLIHDPMEIVFMLHGLVVTSDKSDPEEDNASGETLVQLVHPSLKEFLLERFPSGSNYHAIDPEETHRELAEICINYIINYISTDRSRAVDHLEHFPLLYYACKYWIDHTKLFLEFTERRSLGPRYDAVEANHRSRLAPLITTLLTKNNLDHWVSIYDPEQPNQPFDGSARSQSSSLQYAARTGLTEVVTHLLASGVNVSSANINGRQALHSAVEQALKSAPPSSLGVVRVLLNAGANPLASDEAGNFPLLAVASSDQTELIEVIYKFTDRKRLIEITDGSTLLHLLAQKPTANLMRVIFESKAANTYEPSKSHVDINLKDSHGRGLLHTAVKYENVDVMTVLIRIGADTNLRDTNGDTPLHLAASNGHESSMEILINHGADPGSENWEGKTPLELAWEKKALDWSCYVLDTDQMNRKRITPGMQADCDILIKRVECEGPQFIFRKTYKLKNLTRGQAEEVLRVQLRESRNLQRINHPFIVSYLGYEESTKRQEAVLYLEYCEGGDLGSLYTSRPYSYCQSGEDDEESQITRHRADKFDLPPSPTDEPESLSENEVWTIMYQLFLALVYLHYGVRVNQEGACRCEPNWKPLIHRDIKPSNIVVSSEHGERVAKLCDLGYSREFKTKQSRGLTRGTVDYQPPELSDPTLEEKDRIWSGKGDVFSLAKSIDTLHKNFAVDGELRKLLNRCQSIVAERPSSLDALQIIHQHTPSPFASLQEELGSGNGNFLYQAFEKIAAHLDQYSVFESKTALQPRTVLISRLKIILEDGAEEHFRKCSVSLHYAVLLEKEDMVDQLLNRGINPEARWPNSLWTPLHLACQQGERSLRMAGYLINAGASIRTKDRGGQTPLEYLRGITPADFLAMVSDYTYSYRGNMNSGVQVGQNSGMMNYFYQDSQH